MGQNKKYYWLKLKENFFEEKQIKYLRSLPDGDKIVIAYLKMQLKSLKTEGFIKYDSILPSNIDELAMILDENTNIIKLMIGALQKVNAVEILDDGSFYMIAMQDLIGKEGESAERVRRFRERHEQKMLQCNGDVTKCNTEIEKEIEIDIDKEKEIEIEKNIKKEKKKKETEFDSVINENFTDEELKQTIYEFIKMRKAIKKPMTTRALELLIEKLNKMASNEKEKIAILNQSIEHCWQTIYALKEPLPKEENIAEEIYYNASDLTEEQYAMLMRGELSKGELRKILEEK